MKEGQGNTRGRVILAAIVVVVIVLALVVIGVMSRQDRSPQNETAVEEATTSPSSPTTTTGATGEWLEPTVDVFGRAMKVPANGAGNALGEAAVGDSINCAPTTADVTLQLTHDTPTMWTQNQGPSRVNEDGVPEGYARTAEAALISGWNTTALIFRGGSITSPAVEQGATGDEAAELIRSTREKPPAESPYPDKQAAPTAYKIMSCSDTQVVGDVALPMPTDSAGDPSRPGWIDLRMSMLWKDGDWKLQLGPTPQPVEEEITDLSGWTQWRY